MVTQKESKSEDRKKTAENSKAQCAGTEKKRRSGRRRECERGKIINGDD